jgi:hypothetical protein
MEASPSALGRVAHPSRGLNLRVPGPSVCKGPGLDYTSSSNAGVRYAVSSEFMGRTESKPRPFQNLEGSGSAKCKTIIHRSSIRVGSSKREQSSTGKCERVGHPPAVTASHVWSLEDIKLDR